MAVDEGIVRVLNEAYLKATDARVTGRLAPEFELGIVFAKLGIEDLCELVRSRGSAGIGDVSDTLAAIDTDALVWNATNAVTLLAGTGWRAPREQCPQCGSEAIDLAPPAAGQDERSSAGRTRYCADCDHEWSDPHEEPEREDE